MADPVAIAASVIEMARAERFAGIEELFAPPLRAVVSAATIQTAWTAEAAKIGPVTAVGLPVSEAAVQRAGAGEHPGDRRARRAHGRRFRG